MGSATTTTGEGGKEEDREEVHLELSRARKRAMIRSRFFSYSSLFIVYIHHRPRELETKRERD